MTQAPTEQRHFSRRQRQAAALWAAAHCFTSFFLLFPPNEQYAYGRHTLGVLDVLDGVVRDVRAGKSRYVLLNLPFRHGKSDIGSRRLAPYLFCGEPDSSQRLEVLLASYNFDKAAELSFDARRCYLDAGPLFDRGIMAGQDKQGAWTTTRGDTLYAVGFGGTIAGRGANYLLVDDYYKNRVEAESLIVRNRVRDSFRSDLLTRLAPVHAVIVIANMWHADDLSSWIMRCCTPGTDDYNPDFPQFTQYKWPAQDDDWQTEANPGGWLFPERFSDTWYRTLRAGMSSYAWQALAMQNPRPRQGNLLRADKVVVLDADDFYRMSAQLHVAFKRGWDIASSSEEQDSENPDWTVGTLAGYAPGKVFVEDVVRLRGQAPERDRVMLSTALSDGPGVPIRIESVAGYKDTHDRIARKLEGYTTVEKVTPDRDKVARASVLEAPFETGQVYVKRAPWNAAWLQEMTTFPAKGGGMKVDQVDSLVVAVYDEIMELAQFTVDVF